MTYCYGCRFLIQGGDGSNGCLKYGQPGEPASTPHNLSNPPTPLYRDCREESEKGGAR